MGVYIPKIEKPKVCSECFAFRYEHGDWEPDVYCGITKEELYDATGVGKECPLVGRTKGRWLISNITDRHGRPTGNHRLRCDQCGEKYYLEWGKGLDDYKLCPCCGADMRGEGNDYKKIHM